jgi:hypothetical protein
VEVRRILRAAPAFRAPRRGLRRASDHAVLGALALHLVSPGGQAELASVMAVVDALLADPSRARRELVECALLEGVQLQASFPDVGLDPAAVRAALPPRVRAAWDQVDGLWRQVHTELPPSLEDRPSYDDYLALGDADRRAFRSAHRVMEDGSVVALADVLRWEVRRGTGPHLRASK